MKISLLGFDGKLNEEVASSIISNWPNYSLVKDNIFGKCEIPENLKIESEKLNENEKELFSKMCLISEQYNKYKDEKDIIYNGNMCDVLIIGLMLAELGEISDDFLTKIIYWNKKLNKKLDLILYVKPEKSKIDNLTEFESLTYNLYENFIKMYNEHFNECTFFDHENSPAILMSYDDNHISPLFDIIDSKGNEDMKNDLVNFDILKKNIKDKKLLNMILNNKMTLYS